jgi:hypothetical protein
MIRNYVRDTRPLRSLPLTSEKSDEYNESQSIDA